MKQYYVYILARAKRSTMYVGITSDLKKRVYEHKQEFAESFTKKYDIKNLVYFEVHDEVQEAIRREKRLKKWRRGWKYELIEKENPAWEDLYEGL
jgi:putative endonuclease